MFDIEKVRTGLRLLLSDKEKEADEAIEASLAAKEDILDRNARARQQLANAFEIMAGQLNAGEKLSRRQLDGHDITHLPEGTVPDMPEYSSWGQWAGRESQDGLISREMNRALPLRREAEELRSALNLMEDYQSESVSQSAWMRLRLPSGLLAQAMARAHEEKKDA